MNKIEELRCIVALNRAGYDGFCCGECPALDDCLAEWDARCTGEGRRKLRLPYVCGLPSPHTERHIACERCGWVLATEVRDVLHPWNAEPAGRGLLQCTVCGQTWRVPVEMAIVDMRGVRANMRVNSVAVERAIPQTQTMNGERAGLVQETGRKERAEARVQPKDAERASFGMETGRNGRATSSEQTRGVERAMSDIDRWAAEARRRIAANLLAILQD